MSVFRIVTCNCCGRKDGPPLYLYPINVTITFGKYAHGVISKRSVDLCRDCYDTIQQIITPGVQVIRSKVLSKNKTKPKKETTDDRTRPR